MRAVVDHHAHFVPPAYPAVVASIAPGDPWAEAAAAFLARFGDGGSAPPLIRDLGGRLPDLDEAHVAVQVLSLGAGTIWHPDEALRRRLVAAFNEGTLEAAAAHPGRFEVFAQVSLPHVDAAIEESEALAGTPGVAGFGITAHPAGRPIDDERWAPLLDCWSGLGATVFVHPDPAPSPLWEPYWLRWGVGALVEDALTAARIAVADLPRRYPGIRWLIAHAGGGFAGMLERLDALQATGRIPGAGPRRPGEVARELWFDTATTDPRALRAASEAFGAGRLVFGSDHPLGERGTVAGVRHEVERALGDDWPETGDARGFRG